MKFNNDNRGIDSSIVKANNFEAMIIGILLIVFVVASNTNEPLLPKLVKT